LNQSCRITVIRKATLFGLNAAWALESAPRSKSPNRSEGESTWIKLSSKV
jgi:hypothetical protein